MMTTSSSGRHVGAFLLIVTSTVIGLAGTDLVLPAVPGLPAILGGDPARAQIVLASFTAGSAIGLLLFGELGNRFDQRRLLALSLFAYAITSALCSFSRSIDMLIALRFVQGGAGSAAAVFAPGLLRQLYGDDRAVGALGFLGSVESLAPALAPIAGLWLLKLGGWRASFDVLAILALLLAIVATARHRHLPRTIPHRMPGGYGRLLCDPVFLRYAISHACVLGALLIFVFGAPVVFTLSMGGSIADFIVMQGSGILCFIVVANMSGRLVRRFGAERMILLGTALAAAAASAMLIYALAGGNRIAIVAPMFPFLNIGLALRGPPGFHRAIVAAKGDNARGAALAVIAILGMAALGTAAVAPFITGGLVPLTIGTAGVAIMGLLTLVLLPPLAEG